MHARSRPPAADRKRQQRRERKQRYVRRQADGLISLKVEVHEHALAEALQSSGRLTPAEALLRAELERAVTQIVADFIDRWGRVPCDEP